MSAFNNLLSGLLKDAMDSVASTVKDKIEDVIEDALHPDEDENVTVTTAEEITIQSLCHRFGEVTAPMTGEEFIQRMNSVGYEAELYVMPEEMRKQIKMPEDFFEKQMERCKTYHVINKDNSFVIFSFDVYKEEAEAVDRINAVLEKGKENSEGRTFLAEDDNRIFMHTTMVTEKNVFKTYNLYSRIENTLLHIVILEENADAYAVNIVKALQGTGY